MKQKKPFDHIIIDNFFDKETAKKLSSEFLEYNSKEWFFYNNPIENKKTLNNWNIFPKTTYSTFSNLTSKEYITELESLTGISKLYSDVGLHGGGWHIHGNGGKLNVHLDYSIHPKLKLQRKLNLIIYLSEDWDPNWGGNLEFWSHDETLNKPKTKEKVIDCKFNRAVIFDTTQNSWHGFPEEINCPKNIYRKSLAVYYLIDPEYDADPRTRALFSASKTQENNESIINLIKERSM